MSGPNPKITNYIEDVCQQIKCKEVHAEIRAELRSHIEEMIDDLIADGFSEEEAIERAIQKMGDSSLVGKQFHQQYKPKTEWTLIATVLAFIGVGLLVMYSIEQSQSIGIHQTSLFLHKFIFVLIGIVLAVSLFFFDYRKLQKYSVYVYFGILAVLFYTVLSPTYINGIPTLYLGPFTANIIHLSPYFLVIALAGMLSSWDWRKTNSWIKIIGLIVLPNLIYLKASTYFPILMFNACCFVQLLGFQAIREQKQKIWIALSVGVGLMAYLFLSSETYIKMKLSSFFNQNNEPLMGGYVYIQSKEAIASAGYWGHGLASTLDSLPYAYVDFAFTYFVYAFGWVAGALFIGFVLLFISRLYRVSNELQDPFGRLVTIGLITIFSMKFVWTILMSFGLAPYVSMGLPFISYGGSVFLMQMFAIGLILSVYRIKDRARVLSMER